MGFSITDGINPIFTALALFIVAVPAAIVIVWLFAANRQAREELHDEDDTTPLA